MNRINFSFITGFSQDWLFYSYVEYAAPISTMNDKNSRTGETRALIMPDTLDETAAPSSCFLGSGNE
jgi:hypothetical protein